MTMKWTKIDGGDGSLNLPDDERLVLVYMPESNEPVWIGYYVEADDNEDDPVEEGEWRGPSGEPLPGVTHWAYLPEGPKDD
jgi:hypothetical protein